ncbi:hypothetical protein FH609_010750 [Streptomyces sp. 3MP-14]|uniref:Secreted protein n=1 Tax=Streptomyces mimosae TaxID=2586635 RepID=A0A5N6AIV1_9ACTN|nr:MULTISPECIES: HAD domain-containing protein [Streptomyces]KAB8167993.1 hypothetical protein FH607_006670 [Streptomyces mimosae]KAB8177713.1 hypothetical protein FH609_010750 [Streptomyces sp. 3MP-14]
MDVDGVLNPYAAETCPEGYREFPFFPDEEPVRLCVDHGTWLASLAHHFELAWATGWEDEANEHIAPLLGLPVWPVVRFPPVPFDPSEKVPAIAAQVGAERPVAWVDDRHTPEAWTWMRARSAPTLLVPVDPAVGLTPAAVKQLLAWHATL